MVIIEDNKARMDQAVHSSPQQNKFRSVLLLAGIILALLAGGMLFVIVGSSRTQQQDMQTKQPQQTPVDSTSRPNETTAAPTIERKDIMVEGGSYYFKPNQLRVKKGDTVKIIFNNVDGTHDFVIDEFNVKTNQITAGKQETVTFVADKAGTFEFYCSVGPHRQMGMRGKLIVE